MCGHRSIELKRCPQKVSLVALTLLTSYFCMKTVTINSYIYITAANKEFTKVLQHCNYTGKSRTADNTCTIN